jgi:hypothetical protein
VIRSDQAAHQQQRDQFDSNHVRSEKSDGDLFCRNSLDGGRSWNARREKIEHFAE